jgi:hypothetical protein
MAYLKPKQEYVDSYDKVTVSYCRDEERFFEELKKSPNKKVKKGEEQMYIGLMGMAKDLVMYFVIGDRYKNKEKTIKEWMDRDKAKDELLESAEPIEGVRCLKCGSLMNPNFRDLYDWGTDNRVRVLFMYDCPKGCIPRRAFYSDGEEYIPKHTGAKLDFSKTKEKHDPDFLKDKARFCLTEEKGQEYIRGEEDRERLSELMKKHDEIDENKEALSKIEKLTAFELEKFLSPKLGRQGYMGFKFGTPEIGKDIFLPFTVTDTHPRGERESSYDLKRLVHKVLEGVNWRLMSDGISYRVGILSGRLRAYEKDEDLLKLIKK